MRSKPSEQPLWFKAIKISLAIDLQLKLLSSSLSIHDVNIEVKMKIDSNEKFETRFQIK